MVFRFVKQPEHITVGSRLLFRQGITKGMGEVVKIYSISETECSSCDDTEISMQVEDEER